MFAVKNERQFGPLVRLNFVFNGPMVWLSGEFGCNVASYRWPQRRIFQKAIVTRNRHGFIVSRISWFWGEFVLIKGPEM